MDNHNAKFESDKRQFGGMLMICGFCAIIQPIGNIVSAFGPDGAINTDASEVPFWGMIGAFCLFINGICGVLLGYMACVHDFSHPYLTLGMIVIIQTAWIPYMTDMSNLGMMADNDPSMQGLIPGAYNPSQGDVRFVAAMGVMAVLCYGFAFVGSLSFMTFCLHMYNTGEYQQRAAGYFKGRMGFYCGTLTLGGLVQLMLGAYCAANFSATTLDEGRIRAAMLIVNYPLVSVVIGSIQIIHGLWGFARSMGFHNGPEDNLYQMSMAVQWIMVVCLQIVMQISYLPGDAMAAAAAGVTGVTFGLTMMPAFLDLKMRTTPEEFPQHYYLETQSLKEAPPGMDVSSALHENHVKYVKEECQA